VTRGERLAVRAVSSVARRGSLHLVLPSGAKATIGAGPPEAQLVVHDATALPRMLRGGLTGVAEAYMDGQLDTPDLAALLRWGGANHDTWLRHPLARAVQPAQRLARRVGPERRHPRVVSMNDHYNLGNAFYAAWLDETMTYSSARFAHPDQDLAAAQRNKYRTIADHAGLQPGMRVLEIGCGWGGFAEYAAAERGCEVVAITLSEEQAAHARTRMDERGLGDRVTVDITDFRAVTGDFDAVVSIEMIESIDERQWPDLFTVIARSLRPQARAVLQAITITDAAWQRYRARTDFIRQYIFPGGQLPAPKVLHALADGAGLAVEQVETFGLDYARTLATWRDRFEAAWPVLRSEHALDERFHRMWALYLCLCETGFRMGRTDVEQWVLAGSA
jgi:cyclopropane-fatty-acyl-phospholipid synthase